MGRMGMMATTTNAEREPTPLGSARAKVEERQPPAAPTDKGTGIPPPVPLNFARD